MVSICPPRIMNKLKHLHVTTRLFNVWTYGIKPHSSAYTLYVCSLMPYRFAYGITPYVQTLKIYFVFDPTMD